MEISFRKTAEYPVSLEHRSAETDIKVAEHSFAGGQR